MELKLRDNIQVGNKLIRRGSVIYLYSAKQKAKEILTEEELKMVESLDGTNQFKYTAWLATQYKENGVSIEDLSEILTQMKQISIDFQNKSYDQVKKELEKISEKKEKEYTKGLVLNKDYEFIDKNNNYFVFSPLSKKGSIRLGEKTSWCTSRYGEYNKFDGYDEYKVKLYYFLPMIGKEKYAISVQENNIKGFDVDDKKIDYNNILKITGFKKSILKPWKPVKGIHYILTGNPKKDEKIEFIIENLVRFNLDIKKAKINDDLTVNYKGDIYLKCYNFEKIPFNFNKVKGDFFCNWCNSLTSLVGFPREVSGDFDCSDCTSLTSLKGAPKEVGGYFSCSGCYSLTSLEGAPSKVLDRFSCNGCIKLTDLEGAPDIVDGDFNCNYCRYLNILDGAPKEVKGNFLCWGCGVKFTKNDVLQVSDVKGIIVV